MFAVEINVCHSTILTITVFFSVLRLLQMENDSMEEPLIQVLKFSRQKIMK